MSVAVIGLLGIVLLLILIFLRVPIAVSLALSGLVGYAAIDGWHGALKMVGLSRIHSPTPIPYRLCRCSS